jgi:hypothetical protein
MEEEIRFPFVTVHLSLFICHLALPGNRPMNIWH